MDYIYRLISNNPNYIFLSFVLTILVIAGLLYIFVLYRGRNKSIEQDFITIIAHKFQTPLSEIRWLSENLTVGEEDSFRLENIANLRKANQQLISLTGTLTELIDSDKVTRSAYKFEQVELCTLVRQVAEGERYAFHSKNIFFTVTCEPNDIMVNVDVNRISYATDVLLKNALAYTGVGRNVTVKVESDASHAYVSVIDQGIGISKEDSKNIFQKFFRSNSAKKVDTEGFGIGLFLARSIVRRHGGHIEFVSAGEGLGSTFRLSLPKSPQIKKT